MASEENVTEKSCIYEPDFAVICSFFENFSSLCGIQQPSFTELQQMLENTEEISPQLIDLHIRLMRKAKKNVNPERWQKTLAKFCWFSQPDDCWILEQKGYEHLNYSQRLKLLLTLIGAQFDFNAKFKADINKLDVKGLRLEPIGRDKNGHNYWAHMDEKTTIRVYKEDLDEEKWELIAQNREDLLKLIDELMKEKDPNRKLEEIEDDKESEASTEEEEEEEEEELQNDPNLEDEKFEEDEEEEDDSDAGSNYEDEPEQTEDKKKLSTPTSKAELSNANSKVTSVKKQNGINICKTPFAEKLQEALTASPIKSTLKLMYKPRSSNVPTPVKPLNKTSFAQHLQKLDSQNMLRPLLNLSESDKEINSTAIEPDSLKSKINQKFNIIKPVLQTNILKSKLESATRNAKPGLKLEQILKSKLAQKLSEGANNELANTSATENGKKSEELESAITQSSPSISQTITDVENAKFNLLKRKSENPEELEVRKNKDEKLEEEIEEPVMIVTGVGNGLDCNSCNYEDDEIEEPVMFISGVGSGSDCYTGNNEHSESAGKDAPHTSHLTHKVDNILKSTNDNENTSEVPSTSLDDSTPAVPMDTEKKKPKLWTIDAICSSDSSKDVKRDDVSQFPNFNFNKDMKKESPMQYCSTNESYSIFSLTENKDNRDSADIVPTNFYFGSNNQNPCFLSTEINNPSNFKNKSHNVEDIVDDLNKKSDAKKTNFNAESLYSAGNNVNDIEELNEKVDSNYYEKVETSDTDQTRLVTHSTALCSKIKKKLDADQSYSVDEKAELLTCDKVQISSRETETCAVEQSSSTVELGSSSEKTDVSFGKTDTETEKVEPIETIPEARNLSDENDLKTVVESTEQITVTNSDTIPESSPHYKESSSQDERICNELDNKSSKRLKNLVKESPDEVEENQSKSDEHKKEEIDVQPQTDTVTSMVSIKHSKVEETIKEDREIKSTETITNDENVIKCSEYTAVHSELKNQKPVSLSEKSLPVDDERIEAVIKPIETIENAESNKIDEKKNELELPSSGPLDVDDAGLRNVGIESSTSIVDHSDDSVDNYDTFQRSAEESEEEFLHDEKEVSKNEESIVENKEKENISSEKSGTKVDQKENVKEPSVDQVDLKKNERKEEADDTEVKQDKIDDIEETVGIRKLTRRGRGKKNYVETKETNDEKSEIVTTRKRGRPRNESKNEKNTVTLNKKSKKPISESGNDIDTAEQNEEKKLRSTKEKAETEHDKVDDDCNEKMTEDVAAENETESASGIEIKEETKQPAKRGRKKKRVGRKPGTAKTSTTENKIVSNDLDIESNETMSKDKDEAEKDSKKKTPNEPKKKRAKKSWLDEAEVSNIEVPQDTECTPGIRQSRRIAQLKIKEQTENKYQEAPVVTKKTPASQKSKTVTPAKKNKTNKGKSYKPPKDESDDEPFYETASSKRKRKKKKDQRNKKFDPKKAWKQSSESSSEEEEEEDHFEEEDEELAVNDQSDHEFSPESDINEDEEYQPVKRARTAHSKPRAEDKPEKDDLACQNCGTSDQPEWILLCDACDEGWHAACLKPPVMAIPEGDWFCPPCQHNKLITGLQKFLKTYDKAVKKRASEESRRKRLEYVSISFANVIKKEEPRHSLPLSESEESLEEESEEEEEPLYQLRIRRQANVRHRLNEYEELMNSAIEREKGEENLIEPVSNEVEKVDSNEIQSNNNEISNVEEKVKKDNESGKEEEDEEEGDEDDEKETEKVPPIMLQMRNVRKKAARLTNLDASSEDDHYSDEDFKGSSEDDQEEDDDYGKSETDSDEASYRRGRGAPVRRSTRARRTRYDNDFINDNSDDDDEEYGGKKKRKRFKMSESDSEEEDSTWGRRKKTRNSQTNRAISKKRRKRIRFDGESDEEKGRKRNSRVKYGLDDDNDDYLLSRRTRGKKINYQDNLDSESEEEEKASKSKYKGRKIISDDEYVNDEDEQILDKESVGSKSEEASESDGESDKSIEEPNFAEEPNKTKRPKVLESDDSDSPSPVKPLVVGPVVETYEKKPRKTPSNTIVDQPNQPTQENEVKTESPIDQTEKIESPNKEVQLSSEIMKNDKEILVQKIDQNPSLQGLESMAQNLTHPVPVKFPSNMTPSDPLFSGRIAVPQTPPVSVVYEANVKYEGSEGISPHPVRIPSPNKMYAMPDMLPANRPHLPSFMSQQMPPSSVGGPLNILNNPLLPNQLMPAGLPAPRGPVLMQGPMLARPPHMVPPTNVNVVQCGPQNPNPVISNIVPSKPETSPKRRPRGRGKKQLEMERLQRERETIDANRNEDMGQMNILKMPPGETSTIRPPMPFPNQTGSTPPPSQSPFSTYQQIPFSQVSSPVQQQAGNNPALADTASRRIKITPTRMRMTTPPEKVIHFSRSPGAAGMYPVRLPTVSSPSGNGQPVPSDGKPSGVARPSSATAPPNKSEKGTAGPETSEQYYHPTPYPPSQGPRVYGSRSDYAFAQRKPTPPGLYQPQPPASLATSTAPNVVVSRTGGFSASGGPPVSSPNLKTENTTAVTIISPSATQPYPPRYSMPPRVPVPITLPSASKTGQSASFITSTSTTQSSGPAGLQGQPGITTPSQAYPIHQSKPPLTSAGTSPYVASFYTRAPYAPPSTQPPVSFSHTGPTPNFTNSVSGRISSQTPGSFKTSLATAPTTDTNSINSLPPISQNNDYQYSETPSTTANEPETFTQSSSTRYEDENQSTEDASTGEFGGLVSYFSSQREDDLDT